MGASTLCNLMKQRQVCLHWKHHLQGIITECQLESDRSPQSWEPCLRTLASANVFPKLQQLMVDATSCSYNDPPLSLSGLGGLTHLALINCTVCPKGLAQVLNLSASTLMELDLHSCALTLDAEFLEQRGGGGCASLRSLDLGYNDVTDDFAAGFLAGCPKLTTLSLWNCPQIGEETLDRLAESCPHLTALDLSVCSRVTDTALLRLVDGGVRLRKLSLSLCYAVSDASIVPVLAHCGLILEEVDLEQCACSDATLDAMLKHNLALRSVVVASYQATPPMTPTPRPNPKRTPKGHPRRRGPAWVWSREAGGARCCCGLGAGRH